MGFHYKRSEIRDRAEEKHRDSHPEWNFVAWESETKLRRSTGTHRLDGIS